MNDIEVTATSDKQRIVATIQTPSDWVKSEQFKTKLKELSLFKNTYDLHSFIGNVHLALISNPKLNECSLTSFIDVILKIAHYKLPIGFDYVHLIPYRYSGEPKPRCTLQLSYKGIVMLLARAHVFISASCVYSDDKFDYSEGTDPFINHIRSLDARRNNKDNTFKCVYAIARYNDIKFIEIMGYDEIEFIKQQATKYKVSDCWKNYPDEMAKKTVIKRLAKILPVEVDLKEEWEYEPIEPNDSTENKPEISTTIE
ncbi:MAG: recombinase RecT [Rickettsiales bacterium]|nr:recombinase RecT [Rickettsiales bacterium]